MTVEILSNGVARSSLHNWHFAGSHLVHTLNIGKFNSTFFLDSDKTCSPELDCILPTTLSITLSSSTSSIGFTVEIYENLTYNEKEIDEKANLRVLRRVKF